MPNEFVHLHELLLNNVSMLEKLGTSRGSMDLQATVAGGVVAANLVHVYAEAKCCRGRGGE